MKKIFLIGMAVLIVIVAVFVYGGITGDSVKNNVKEFTIKASRFQYSPSEIVVNRGERVRINIENLDVVHGIRIPELDVKGEDAVEFEAEKAGEFVWYCAKYCGDEHMSMRGKIIVK